MANREQHVPVSKDRRTRRWGDRAAAPRGAAEDLRQLTGLFAERDWSDPKGFQRARRRARERAMDTFQGDDADQGVRQHALALAAAELFVAMGSDLTDAPAEAAELASRLEHEHGVPRVLLAHEVLRAPELLTLLPAVAVDRVLAALLALAPLRSSSLWVLDDSERVTCARHVGDGLPSRGAAALAQLLFDGAEADPGARRQLIGRAMGRWRRPVAVLIASARPGRADEGRFYLEEAGPMLEAVLERDALLAANADVERALVESSERKLTRLGYDLHDGPLQDVAVLAEDLRLLWRELDERVPAGVERPAGGWSLRGRMEDLQSQIGGLDGDLRRISNEVRAASVLLNRPFTAALRDVGRAFAARTNIEPRIALSGNPEVLTSSQQIALLNIIREALTNIREHSGASDVAIAVAVGGDWVEATVRDNGCGFDPEQTLMRTAGQGRLGLVGMHERVRLLGGQLRIDSRPGGPTAISVMLERWEPLAAEGDAGSSSA